MHNFRELKVWQRGMELVVNVYSLIDNFPDSEKYGLASQIKRCSVSIPSNIAEGSGRNTPNDFAHFLNISIGSSNELETQLIIAGKLGFISNTEIEKLISEINEFQKMTRKLISTVRAV